jgi:hypothetical protein
MIQIVGLDEIVERLRSPWRPVSQATAIAFSAGMAVLFLLILTDDDGYLVLLDGANLLFHEAGHVFFGVFGSTAGLYGGTLGQLVFPVVTAGTFLWRRQPASFAVCTVWLFENFLNIARYAADARAQVLPLVGSGEHDWTRIFNRWGALEHDTGVAAVIRALGWAGMLATWAWLVWRWWRRDAAPAA